MAKRNFFAELMEGVAAMGVLRQGKVTLRNYKIKATIDLPAMPSKPKGKAKPPDHLLRLYRRPTKN
jgi:hypothetical protein